MQGGQNEEGLSSMKNRILHSDSPLNCHLVGSHYCRERRRAKSGHKWIIYCAEKKSTEENVGINMIWWWRPVSSIVENSYTCVPSFRSLRDDGEWRDGFFISSCLVHCCIEMSSIRKTWADIRLRVEFEIRLIVSSFQGLSYSFLVIRENEKVRDD